MRIAVGFVCRAAVDRKKQELKEGSGNSENCGLADEKSPAPWTPLAASFGHEFPSTIEAYLHYGNQFPIRHPVMRFKEASLSFFKRFLLFKTVLRMPLGHANIPPYGDQFSRLRTDHHLQ